MRISEMLKITKGRLLSGDPHADIDLAKISSDSRTIEKGEFFLPLKGSNFDGENFIGDAFERGAIGAFTEGQGAPPGLSARRAGGRGKGQGNIIIQVKDTLEAMQKIAHYHRMKFDIPVIGVTGSNGKTTTKDMISKVLGYKFNVLKNEGTKNNHIGVPQTLLRLKEEHEACVLEMGTNHPGEIRSLADIARPVLAVITNIGPSHLEFLKDLKGVYRSKTEIFDFFEKDSLAVLNGDDAYLSKIKTDGFKVIRFGFNSSNSFRAEAISTEKGRIKFLVNGKFPVTLKILGMHNIYNALAAITIARHFGISFGSMRRALADYEPACMRLDVKDIKGITIINDAYNSNPLSMKCAIEAAISYPAKARWIVSADMLELGGREKDFHKTIGESIVEAGFSGLITFGDLSRLTSSAALKRGMKKRTVWHCSTREEIADILRKVAKKGDLVLIKGSRAMKMEQVIEKLGRS